MKIILSTRNPSKAEQIQALFVDSNVEVLTLADMGIEGEVEEDGSTLEENALKKALFAHSETKTWAMADDTGLFIDFLNGEPGIKAARWAGEKAETDEITSFTLQKLEGALNRSATFVTVVAVVTPEGRSHFFKGEVRGHLLESPRVRPQPKMPYSPIFQPEGEKLVWAEMTVEHENSISHRGKAFRLAKAFLEEQMK